MRYRKVRESCSERNSLDRPELAGWTRQDIWLHDQNSGREDARQGWRLHHPGSERGVISLQT